MPAVMKLLNPSVSSDLRVMHCVARPEGEGWCDPSPAAALSPMQSGQVILAEKRRTVLETSSSDDVLVSIVNPSLSQTLRLVSLPKKKGESAALIGFVAPSKNGETHCRNVSVNSRCSVAVELLPQ